MMFDYKIFKGLTLEERQAYISHIQDVAEEVSFPAYEQMCTAHDRERRQEALNRANTLRTHLSEWEYWTKHSH